ncbi:hypothetical protein [Pontibaca salina]|uniref:Uncharacterized protein n=1 Tax=Pontibaca salina TaxID=2795731 RepID=A0A934HUV2_9RHOB|nr:hypothetical protein [Pontibaca salina]MBI6630668.1 hypothetical protein [Pontibaca salina]
MDFKKPDMKTRLAQLGFLVKHSFTIVGRNRALIAPVARMAVYAIVMILLLFIGICLVLYDNGNGTWFLLAAGLMFLYKFFYYNRAELTLSRMTWTAATGGTPNHRAARKEISDLRRQIRILGLLDMVGAWVASRKTKAGGFMNMLLGGIVEIWDLVNHFLLPAFAIDKLSLADGIASLKQLKDHVPETLGGVFGLDILGGVVRTLMAPLYGAGVLFGIIVGVVGGHHMPEAFSGGTIGELFPDMPQIWLIGPDSIFSWLPVFVVVSLGVLVHAIFARIVTAIKVIYFTLFYARIEHAEALAPDIRADLEGYLELEQTDAELVPV